MVGCCFFQAEDGIRDDLVTGVQTCALPISPINLQGPMDSTLARKATNDAAAFARTVAAQRGHSIEWAEKRSEERRVGKECRRRRAPQQEKKKRPTHASAANQARKR